MKWLVQCVFLCVVALIHAAPCSFAAPPLRDLDESGLGESIVPDTALGAVIMDREMRLAGEYSLRFEFAQGEPVLWQLAEPVTCQPGSLYLLEARMRCFLLGSAGFKLFVEWLDADGRPIHVKTLFWGQKEYEDTSDWIGATAGWTPERLVVRAPEDAVRARIGCRLESVRPGLERKNRRYGWVDALAWGETVEMDLRGAAVGNVFQDEAVSMTATAGHRPPTKVAFELFDFWNQSFGRFEWEPEGSGASYRLPLPALDPGYYELRWSADAPDNLLPRAGVTSLCVLRPADDAIRPAAVTVDGALSWFYRGEDLEEASALCRKIGIQVIRDRMNWDQVEKKRGTFDPDFLDDSATIQHDAGLDVYQDFTSTPRWALSDNPPVKSLPDDPLDLYRVMENLTRHFRGRVDYWELWNEPYHEASFLGRPDEYVTYLKAAYLGCKAGNPDAVVLTCSFNTIPTLWCKRVVENGALEYADIYNFHSYSRTDNLIRDIGLHKEEMIRCGIHLPMWLTEDGCKSRRNVQGLRLAGEQKSARFLVEHAAMSLAEGVDRYFYFALPKMWEGAEGPWGILRDDRTPMPAYVALGVAREMLGRGLFLDRVHLRPGDLDAYLFDRGDGTGVLVALPDKQRHVRVPGAGPDSRVVDIMGNDKALPFIINESGALEVETGLFPLYVTDLDTRAFDIDEDVDAWPRFDPAARQNPDERKVWFRVDVRGAEMKPEGVPLSGERRDAVWALRDRAPIPFSIIAYNLSDDAAPFTVDLAPEEGLGIAGPVSLTMTIPAGRTATCAGSVLTEHMAPGVEYRLEFAGEAPGFRVAPVYIYFRLPPGDEPAE